MLLQEQMHVYLHIRNTRHDAVGVIRVVQNEDGVHVEDTSKQMSTPVHHGTAHLRFCSSPQFALALCALLSEGSLIYGSPTVQTIGLDAPQHVIM